MAPGARWVTYAAEGRIATAMGTWFGIITRRPFADRLTGDAIDPRWTVTQP